MPALLGGLYIKPDMKIDRYETEESHIAFWSSLSKCLMFRNDMKFISG